MLNRLYAIRYGKGFKYGGADFTFIYYLANVQDQWILIDTGFSSKELAEVMGISLIPVDNEIRDILNQNVINNVLITHSHWDHIDDIYMFSSANIFLSEKTYEKAMIENCDLTKLSLQKAKEESRIVFLDSGSKAFHSFTYEFVGGHAEDSGVFYFTYGDREYCIAGDECFSVENIKKNIPIDNAFNIESNILFTKKCYENSLIVLPAHDDAVFHKYQKVSENIVQII